MGMPDPNDDPISDIREQAIEYARSWSYTERVLISQQVARQRWSDYDAMEARAIQLAQDYPWAKAAILTASDPAAVAYEIGKAGPGYVFSEGSAQPAQQKSASPPKPVDTVRRLDLDAASEVVQPPSIARTIDLD